MSGGVVNLLEAADTMRKVREERDRFLVEAVEADAALEEILYALQKIVEAAEKARRRSIGEDESIIKFVTDAMSAA